MNVRNRSRLAALLATAFLWAVPLEASAIFRAYLSLDGVDTNPCTLPQPCRLLPAALAAVDANGEIWMLDSANYNTGTVTVTKSVTILAVPGVLGSVVANGAHALVVSGAGVNVALRNLNFRPLSGSAAFDAIRFTTGASLLLQQCNVFDFTAGRGLHATAEGATVGVFDSAFRNNGTGALFEGTLGHVSNAQFVGGTNGVVALASASGMITRVMVNASVAAHLQDGFTAQALPAGASASLFVNRSTMENNSTSGVKTLTDPGATGTAAAMVRDSVVSTSGFALFASGSGSRIIASRNAVNFNLAGFVESDGANFESSSDNTGQGNSVQSIGTITVVPKL